jgi:hypothetical protein
VSVNVRVALLIEYDDCVHNGYMRINERWTLTLPKFDEPFGVRFHFKRFLGTDVG